MGYLKTTTDGNKLIVTLDRPPLNLFDHELYNEINAFFTSVNDMDDVYTVVLRATGKNFSAGNDIAELKSLNAENIEEHYRIVGESFAAVYNCRKPVVAAVHGYAVGAGMALPAACDVIIASEDATFFVPEIKVGIIGASEFLELIVPRKIARYYAYTGKPIPVKRLYEWGSVLEIVSKENLLDTALKVADELLESAPQALESFKLAMNHNDDERLLEKFYKESEYGIKFIPTDDYRECVNAFYEKRKAVYKSN